MSKLSTLFVFISPHEGYHMKNVLAEHGITAVLQGAESAAAFGHLGPSTDARLLVPTADLERARELVERIEAELFRNLGSRWFCGPCEEENEGSFDYCWLCNKAREAVEDTTVDLSPKSDERFGSEANSTAAVRFDSDNPYASSRIAADERSDGFSAADETQITRAFQASVLGLLFLPVLMSLYSMMLLATVPHSGDWPKASTRSYYRAWILNVLAIILWSTFFLVNRFARN